RCYDARQIPEVLERAWRYAFDGAPGPVYVDLPSNVLNAEVAEPSIGRLEAIVRPRPQGSHADVERAAALVAKSDRPVVLSGSGILWSGAEHVLRAFVQERGLPLFTTPQGRGILREDDPHNVRFARRAAFREADCVVVVGTRLNWLLDH